MCDPFTIGATLLSGVGSAMQADTNAQYVDAVNAANKEAFDISQKARTDEQNRQDEYQAEAESVFTETMAGSGRSKHDHKRRNAAEDFTKTLQERPDVLDSALAVSDTASDAVKEVAARKTNAAAKESRERIAALAALNSYGAAGSDFSRMLTGASGDMATIGGLRRGSLGVASQEQGIAPAQVTPGTSTFGQILSGAGSMVGMAGPGLFSGGMAGSMAPQTSPRPRPRPRPRPSY